MDILKSKPKSLDNPEQPNKGRRSFIWGMGAAVSAFLASAVPGKTSTAADQSAVQRLSNRLAILEDEKAILRLHRNYENCLNNGRYEEALNLFTGDGEAVFNGGIFKGETGGLYRLYNERFKSGWTGRRIEPAPGFQHSLEQEQFFIQVGPDRKSAGARFPYSIQVGAPIISDSQLVQMARLHGEGIMKWWEVGVYEISYVKDAKTGGWKIKRLEYRVLAKADYRPGKSHAGPISVPLFSKVYPEDPAGPDALFDQAPKT